MFESEHFMTLAHCGILISVFGTICLAYAVKIENKYTLSAKSKKERKSWKEIVDIAQDDSYYEPSIVYIDKVYFRIGLACVALGSIMQW